MLNTNDLAKLEIQTLNPSTPPVFPSPLPFSKYMVLQ